jgi:hypothetical protein
LLESAIANPETQQTDQNETRDLMAQEASALWGYWLLVIAALQLIATIIGLVFIKRTLDATWKAVGDTCEATVAMKRQNELTERAFREASTTSRAQLRTYFSSLRESCEISDAGTAFKCIPATPDECPRQRHKRPKASLTFKAGTRAERPSTA